MLKIVKRALIKLWRDIWPFLAVWLAVSLVWFSSYYAAMMLLPFENAVLRHMYAVPIGILVTVVCGIVGLYIRREYRQHKGERP